MKVNGREILLRRKFIIQVDSAAEFIREKTDQKAVVFIEEIEELIYEKIPLFPFSHPEFLRKPTKEKVYRKAVFRKKWNIIYKVSETTIVFVYFYHSSRNPENLDV